MQLWQMDLVGGVLLADGRSCKVLSGIDDHSRFVVIAAVLERPSGNAVVEAFLNATNNYGVPFEVLTDNGKQFTGRFTRPLPAEVLFERTCRELGITQKLTKRRSPTTTGKVERWHQTLRRELLDEAGAFSNLTAAQQAIDGWVHSYNHQRPHQSPDIATPASLFRPRNALPPAPKQGTAAAGPNPAEPLTPPQATGPRSTDAVQFELQVPPSGVIPVAKQHVWVGRHFAGRTVTIWVDQVSIHIGLDGLIFKTITSRLSDTHLDLLRGRGARAAGPPPAQAALSAGRPSPPNSAVKLDRTATRDGTVPLAGHTLSLGPELAGARITLRVEAGLLHAINNGHLVKTLPSPINPAHRTKLHGPR